MEGHGGSWRVTEGHGLPLEGHAKRRYGEIAYLAGGSELLNEVTMLAVDAHEQYAGQKKAWTAMRRGGHGELRGDVGRYGRRWSECGGMAYLAVGALELAAGRGELALPHLDTRVRHRPHRRPPTCSTHSVHMPASA